MVGIENNFHTKVYQNSPVLSIKLNEIKEPLTSHAYLLNEIKDALISQKNEVPTIRVKIEFTIKDTKPKKKKITKSKTKMPNRERKILKASKDRGKKVKRM